MDLLFLFLALLGLLVYFRRGVVFLFLANRAFDRKDEVKTLAWFEEAWKIRQLAPGMVTAYAYQLLKAGLFDRADDVLATFRNERRSKKPLKTADVNLVRTYQSLVLWKQGKLDEAVDELLNLRAEGYQTTTLYGNLGYLLLEKGDLEVAEKVCVEARDWSPTGKVILDNLGALRLAQGNLVAAQEAYEALIDLQPKFPEAWYGAASVALKLDNPETAIELLEYALTLPFNAMTTISRSQVEQKLAEARTA